METLLTTSVGCWRIVKESITEPASESASNEMETTSFNDAYDYFPDFGI